MLLTNRHLTQQELSALRKKYLEDQISVSEYYKPYREAKYQAQTQARFTGAINNSQASSIEQLATQSALAVEQEQVTEQDVYTLLLRIATPSNAKLISSELELTLDDSELKAVQVYFPKIERSIRESFSKGVSNTIIAQHIVNMVRDKKLSQTVETFVARPEMVDALKNTVKNPSNFKITTDGVVNKKTGEQNTSLSNTIKNAIASPNLKPVRKAGAKNPNWDAGLSDIEQEAFLETITSKSSINKDPEGWRINEKGFIVNMNGYKANEKLTTLWRSNVEKRLKDASSSSSSSAPSSSSADLFSPSSNSVPLERVIATPVRTVSNPNQNKKQTSISQMFGKPKGGNGIIKMHIGNMGVSKGKGSQIHYRKKGEIFGYGVSQTLTKPRHRMYARLNKYMISWGDLCDNMLVMKHVCNQNICKLVPKQMVSNAVRDIIKGLCDDEFHKTKFDELSEKEKETIITICNACHIDIGYGSKEDHEQTYNVLIGEYRSGNKGALPKLRKFITHLEKTGYISTERAYKLLSELD